MAVQPFLYISIRFHTEMAKTPRDNKNCPRDVKSTEGRAEGLRFPFPVAKMTMDAP